MLVKDGWGWWYRKYALGDTVLEGLERDAREGQKGCGLIRSRCCLGVGKENPLRQLIEGKLRGVGGRGIVGRGVMDRANTGGKFGDGDAMVLCKSTLGLPISSEENF